jgi:predicted nucleic acid-binding protein
VTLYLDTSALLKLYVAEPAAEVVRRGREEAARVATSCVTYVEARAALARRLREGVLAPDAHQQAVADLDGDWERYDRLVADDDLARLAGALAERCALRGFDAVQLASALQLHNERGDVRFLAFDSRLVEAARTMLPMYVG